MHSNHFHQETVNPSSATLHVWHVKEQYFKGKKLMIKANEILAQHWCLYYCAVIAAIEALNTYKAD